MKNLLSFACSSLLVSLVGCGDNVSVPDGVAAQFPSTCQESADSADGTHTLYVGNDETKPWTAFCHLGNEYLPLNNDATFGEIATGGAITGDTVRTSYRMLRIDPVSLLVDITDTTYATSSGRATFNGKTLTSAPAGVAFACDGSNTTASSQIAFIDTPFIAQKYATGGTSANGHVALFRKDRWQESFVSGSCGQIAPQGVASPLELTDGFTLQLTYAGPLVEP
jgi:hypothetical protein